VELRGFEPLTPRRGRREEYPSGPESNRAAIINDLIRLFDGPQRREAQRLATEALAEAGEGAS
jgi:hypothetical protein